jgi:hypothetical protein
VRIWRFRPGRGGSGWVGVGRVLLKTGQNLCGTSSPEPQNLQNLPEPRQNLARTLTEPPRQNLRTSERDPRRFWRFWRGLGEVFGGSEVLGQNLRFCIQNLRLVLYGHSINLRRRPGGRNGKKREINTCRGRGHEHDRGRARGNTQYVFEIPGRLHWTL